MNNQPLILSVELSGYRALPRLAQVMLQLPNLYRYVGVSSLEAALQVLRTSNSVFAVITNFANLEFSQFLRQSHPEAKAILVTDAAMKYYHTALEGEDYKLIDYFIANKSPESWTRKEVSNCLKNSSGKIIFGIDHLLEDGTKIYSQKVRSSEEREAVNSAVMSHAIDCQLSQHLARGIFGVSEELLMNAIYDAPAASNLACYQDIPRTKKVTLREGDEATIKYGSDGERFIISTTDPFGSFKRETFFKYAQKTLRRSEGTKIIDQKKGGAGLGLFKILYNVQSLTVNVLPEQKTETIAIFNTKMPPVDYDDAPRSLLFFEENLASHP